MIRRNTNQFDHSYVNVRCDGTSCGIHNSSSATNSIAFDQNVSTGCSLNEEDLQSSVVTSTQRARVEGISRTQNEAVTSRKLVRSCSSSADSEIVSTRHFARREIEHIAISRSSRCSRIERGTSRLHIMDRDFVCADIAESLNSCACFSINFCQSNVLSQNDIYSCNFSVRCLSLGQRCNCEGVGGCSICIGVSFGAVNSSKLNLRGSNCCIRFIDSQFLISSSYQLSAVSASFSIYFGNQQSAISSSNERVNQGIEQRRCISDSTVGGNFAIQRGPYSIACSEGSAQTGSSCVRRCSISSYVRSANFCSKSGVISSNSRDSCCSGAECNLSGIQSTFCCNSIAAQLSGCWGGGWGWSHAAVSNGVTRNHQRIFDVANFHLSCRAVFVDIKRSVSSCHLLLIGGDCCLGRLLRVDQCFTWNQTWQGAVADATDSSSNRSRSTIYVVDNGSGSDFVERGTSSVNPSTVKAQKAIFKGLNDI